MDQALFPRAAPLWAAATACALLGAAVARAESVWAEIEAPRNAQRVREPVGLVEVRGTAGTGLPGRHDVVIVIDLSGSTWKPSGADVDGDEVTGSLVRTRIAGREIEQPTDPDDSIAEAQVRAARDLVRRLDPELTRLGLVVFGGAERVLARIGAAREEILTRLDELPGRPLQDGTYFYGALVVAIELLEEASLDAEDSRHRSIILLSDGNPNRPFPLETAEKASLRAARHAARAQARIYAFAIGPEVVRDPGVFRALTDANGGELLLVENPADVIAFVPHMSLTHLSEVSIRNASTGELARAVRLFPDGSFDGYAPLAPGDNRVQILVRAESGAEAMIERLVHFEKTSVTDERRLRILLEELRARTRETQLANEARRRRSKALQRTLEITTEGEPAPDPGRPPPEPAPDPR
jgi:Mg-chelatase subunit ChlD